MKINKTSKPGSGSLNPPLSQHSMAHPSNADLRAACEALEHLEQTVAATRAYQTESSARTLARVAFYRALGSSAVCYDGTPDFQLACNKLAEAELTAQGARNVLTDLEIKTSESVIRQRAEEIRAEKIRRRITD